MDRLGDGRTPIDGGYKMSGEEAMVQGIETGLLGTRLQASARNALTGAMGPKFTELSECWEQAGLLEKARDGRELRVTVKGCWFMGNMIEELRQALLKDRREADKAGPAPPDRCGA